MMEFLPNLGSFHVGNLSGTLVSLIVRLPLRACALPPPNLSEVAPPFGSPAFREVRRQSPGRQ